MKIQLTVLTEALVYQKKKFSINFSRVNTKFCLSLHYLYLASSIDNLVVTCGIIVNVVDSISANRSADFMSTMSTNFQKSEV